MTEDRRRHDIPRSAPDDAPTPGGFLRREPPPRPETRDHAPVLDPDHHVVPRRYLTADVPPVGGYIKERPEDFLVDEIPLYEPVGHGEHLYLLVEKRGLSTFELIDIVARHFKAPRKAIGHAGLKDKLAVTRQMLSVHLPGRRLDEFRQLTHDRVVVLGATWHENKLRPGHLAGNRFSIRLRGVEPTGVVRAKRVLDALARLGAPARLGEQRFGFLLNNHLLGRALILRDWRGAADLLLGPAPRNPTAQAEARALYAEGRFREARDAMPLGLRTERIVLDRLARGRPHAEAFGAVDRKALMYYISACQSAVFNALLDRRIEAGTLATLRAGDLAMKHANGATFLVDPITAEDPTTRARLDAFEISPTGPMWGSTMQRAEDEVDIEETEALAALGLSVEDLAACAERSRGLIKGARRPYRVPVTNHDVEAGVDEHGTYIRCVFDLPRGAFATAVMREIIKPPETRVHLERRLDAGPGELAAPREGDGSDEDDG